MRTMQDLSPHPHYREYFGRRSLEYFTFTFHPFLSSDSFRPFDPRPSRKWARVLVFALFSLFLDIYLHRRPGPRFYISDSVPGVQATFLILESQRRETILGN